MASGSVSLFAGTCSVRLHQQLQAGCEVTHGPDHARFVGLGDLDEAFLSLDLVALVLVRVPLEAESAVRLLDRLRVGILCMIAFGRSLC